MGIGVNGGCNFPLTSLQIGDLRSYLSDISLFLANDSKKMYILVDNRPWLRDLGYWSAHFWQLMITKSRLSPFANTKIRRGRKEEKEICSESCSPSERKNSLKWFSLIDAAMLSREKVLLPVEKLSNSLQFSSELHRTLHGFIVFEVAWTNVRGINYLSVLQTDASLAIETKLMRRWEFDDIAQAVRCICSWFSGTLSEQMIMKEHLDSAAATAILYPIFWIVWRILYAPIRLVLAVSSVVAFICSCICDIVGDVWLFASGIFQLASSSEATVNATVHEVSMLRSLWNDLFSQIFRAIRSILYGFVAFFTACNRHRLSIYNHLQEFIKRLYRQCRRSQKTDLRDDRTCQAPN